MRKSAQWALSALIAWSLFGGCAELPDVKREVCGNHIVDVGEDCDGIAPAGRVCRKEGTAGECRYDCTANADGKRPDCPAGWGCGTDSICRASAGAFTPTGEPIPALAFFASDFDGDQREDLLFANATEILVRYSEADGASGKTLSLPRVDLDLASAGDMTADGLTDLLLPIGIGGIGVLQAQADRSLVPVVQSSIQIDKPVAGSRVVPIEALESLPGVEALAIVPIGPGVFGALAINNESNPNEPEAKPLFELADDAAKIGGDIPVGELFEDPLKPCQELVLGYKGATGVAVYTPCKDDSSYAFGAAPHPVKLPAGDKVSGPVFIADVNGDYHLDLVISAVDNSGILRVDVAYGLGTGTFHSDYQNLPATGPGDDQASLLVEIGASFGEGASSSSGGPPMAFDDGQLLAVGDLNGDGRADGVSGSFINLSYDPGDGTLAYAPVYTGESWSSVVIADFNGNGFADIIGGSRDIAGIDFYNGVGNGVFNPFKISTQGPTDHYAAGDFDGDLINDLAFSEKSTSGLDDSLSFLFGRSIGAPEEPVSAGRLHAIQQIASGDRLLEFIITGGLTTTADGIADLALLSLSADNKQGNLTVVPGSSDRRLQSPYLLVRDKGIGPEVSAPVRSTIGQLNAEDRWGDVAMLAYDADYTFHIWVLPSDQDGKFGDSAVIDLPADFGVYAFETDYAVTAADLDGPPGADSIDEVILVAPNGSIDGTTPPDGSVAIIRLDVEGGAVEVHRTPQQLRGFVRAADIDGDGYAEIIAIADDFSAIVGEDAGSSVSSGGGPTDGGRQIVVFWNDAGTIDFDNPVILPDVPTQGYANFVALNADADPEKEIAIATGGGVLIVDVDLGKRTFTNLGPLPGVPGGARVVAGDIDGDGVDDIVVGDPFAGESTILLGKPVRR